MVVIIKKSTPRNKLKTLLRKAQPAKAKGLDAMKHLGKLKLEEDPLAIQRRLRDEWD